MKNIFIYSFEKECRNHKPEEIIKSFQSHFSFSGCYHNMKVINSGLELKDSMHLSNYAFVSGFNIWYLAGDIKVEVNPTENDNVHIVKFSVDNSTLFIPVVFILFASVVGVYASGNWVLLLIALGLILLITSYRYVIMYFHRKFFYRATEINVF